MKNKKTMIILTMSFLILMTLSLFVLSYAYYKTRIISNTNEKSVSVTSKKLSVIYQNESAVITAEGIEPGYTATKTFEVKNDGDEDAYFSIILDNLENTFTRYKDWNYVLSENNIELKSGILPKKDNYILRNEYIEKGSVKKYTLILTYDKLDKTDQSIDMNKTLSLRINISSEANTWENSEEGTLLYALKNNNEISTPKVSPGHYGVEYSKYEENNDTTNSLMSFKEEINYYWIYATGYTFDEKTGLYTLTGIKTGKYIDIYKDINHCYLISFNAYTNSSLTEEEVKSKNSKNLSKIYEIIDTSENSISYKKKEGVGVEIAGIFASEEDDYGTSYYFRGNVKNNYVNYSKMCWRIVRVQGNGDIKLALADGNGECNASTYSTSNTTSAFVDNRTDIAYISNQTKDTSDLYFEDSDVATILNEWSKKKGLDTSKLVETEWCNDITYNSFNRLSNPYNAKPSLKCDLSFDKNAQYINTIGVLTADELVFAGSMANSQTTYYLTINAQNSYWTMTSSSKISYYNLESVWRVSSGGNLLYQNVLTTNNGSVRPSIVLTSNVTISGGDGTNQNPYVIS